MYDRHVAKPLLFPVLPLLKLPSNLQLNMRSKVFFLQAPFYSPKAFSDVLFLTKLDHQCLFSHASSLYGDLGEPPVHIASPPSSWHMFSHGDIRSHQIHWQHQGRWWDFSLSSSNMVFTLSNFTLLICLIMLFLSWSRHIRDYFKPQQLQNRHGWTHFRQDQWHGTSYVVIHWTIEEAPEGQQRQIDVDKRHLKTKGQGKI